MWVRLGCLLVIGGIILSRGVDGTTTTTTTTTTTLVDSSGVVKRQLPKISTANGVLVVISSPGTPSFLGSTEGYLSLDEKSQEQVCLFCRGATLSAAPSAQRLSLCMASLVAGAIVVDGITEGDLEMGLRDSRHARTLTALFRARLSLDGDTHQQTLLLNVMGSDDARANIQTELENIFDATAAEFQESNRLFSDMYAPQIVSIQNEADAQQVLVVASEAAAAACVEEGELSVRLSDAQSRIRAAGVAALALDPPRVAVAFLAGRRVYAKLAKTVRAKLSVWKSRTARGLVVDRFGEEATLLYRKTLDRYDEETLAAAGMPLVAEYRLGIRNQLQGLLQKSLRELFFLQVTNLQASILKKFHDALLRNTETETALRTAIFDFDAAMDKLEVLDLTKANAVRDMRAKLQETLEDFPNSPRAKLKRTGVVQKATARKRKPSSRAVDVGLDLVAMLRPDGFGTLQGFCAYQLGGNSLTVGFQNDADDPQVIAQAGGTRPPLLRVQPKLRVDVEL